VALTEEGEHVTNGTMMLGTCNALGRNRVEEAVGVMTWNRQRLPKSKTDGAGMAARRAADGEVG